MDYLYLCNPEKQKQWTSKTKCISLWVLQQNCGSLQTQFLKLDTSNLTLDSWNSNPKPWNQTPSLERSKNLSGYEIAHNAGANVTYYNFPLWRPKPKGGHFFTGSFASVAFYSKIHTWKHTTKKEKDYKDSLNLHSGCPVSLKAMPKINSEANNSWHCFQ